MLAMEMRDLGRYFTCMFHNNLIFFQNIEEQIDLLYL